MQSVPRHPESTYCRSERVANHQIPTRGKISELSSKQTKPLRPKRGQFREIVHQISVDQQCDEPCVDELSNENISCQACILLIFCVLLLEPRQDLQDNFEALVDNGWPACRDEGDNTQLVFIVDVLLTKLRF